MANSVKNAKLSEEIIKSLQESNYKVEPNEDVVAVVNTEGGSFIVNLECEHENLPLHVVVGVMMQAKEDADPSRLLDVANEVNDIFLQGKMVVDADKVIRLFVAEAEELIEDFPEFFTYAFQTIGIMAGTLMSNHGDLFDVENIEEGEEPQPEDEKKKTSKKK